MSKAIDAIRDRMPVQNFDRHPRLDSDREEGRDDSPEELLTTDSKLRERLLPSGLWQWFGTIVGSILLLTAALYLWPLIPPWFKSVAFLKWAAIPLTGLIVHLKTRKTMLTWLQNWDTVLIKDGDHVVPKIGKVEGTVGEDPAFKELKSVGFAGLFPSFRKVDDEYRTEQPLMNKANRKDRYGNWEAAKGRLDHKYIGEGESDLLGSVYVVNTSGTRRTPRAPDHDWSTDPPNTVDSDSARALKSETELYRTEIVPHYEQMLDTKDYKLQKALQESFDSPVMPLQDIPSLLQQLGMTGRHYRNGQAKTADPELSPNDRVQNRVDETMEEILN